MWIIGERINPTGKPGLISAIIRKDRTFIQNEARLQEKAGAQALDINVGIAGINRADAIRFVVQSVRDVTDLPLVIDEQEPEVIESALDYIGNGTWINSPVDVENNLGSIAGFAKTFEAELIILPLQEGRLTENISEHVKAADRILRCFADFGIPKERVIVDAMLFPLKQAKERVTDALERIKRLRDLGVRTVIGLSNLSFGLGGREVLNAGFLKLAQAAGLDAVICDPLQKRVMEIANGSGKNNSDSGQKEFLKLAEACLTQ